MRTHYLDQSCVSQLFFSFCPLSLDLRNVLKEGLLSPLNGASLLQQKFLLLFLFKLSCLCQHCFLFFCNLYSFVSIEQNPFSPRFSAITTLTITIIIIIRSPVKHVIGIGPVQLAAGGQGLVQLDQGGGAVSSAHTEQAARLVNLETECQMP